jgi:hypothetical protein
MRKFISMTAVALVLLGVTWRFAGWILEWIGRLLGTRGLNSSYEVFVESYVPALMAEGSFPKILGPWLSMGAGLILLAVLYFPRRKDSKVR